VTLLKDRGVYSDIFSEGRRGGAETLSKIVVE